MYIWRGAINIGSNAMKCLSKKMAKGGAAKKSAAINGLAAATVAKPDLTCTEMKKILLQ